MPFNIWTDVQCTSGCNDELLFGQLATDQNCQEVPYLSQISDLYITPVGGLDAFDYSGGNPTLVSGGIDNADLTNSKTKWLVGIGGVAEPEETPYNGPKGSILVIKRIYTLEFEVNVRSNLTRDFLRQLQCNPKNFTFRFGTRGGQLYGGEDGIEPFSSNARLVLGNGAEDFELGRIIITYEMKNGVGDPPRHPNPHAG
jgi:hypothetical protein